MKKFTLLAAFVLMVAFAFANKTSVQINAPEKATNGKMVKISIQVFHNGNSKMHHTDWVVLSLNGQPVKRWEYSKSSLPENENFTLEYSFILDGNTSITAQGDCNIHGSKGPVTVVVAAQ